MSAPRGRGRSEPGRLVADFVVRRGGFTVGVELDVAPGEVLAILGPNGAGKSTVLAVLAGLLAPSRGTVRLGDRVLSDRATGSRARVVPPEQRRVTLLAQDPMLFPHLTALENIAFGPRSSGMPRQRAREVAKKWLVRCGLDRPDGAAGLGQRRPAQLSGGQRQRVALARALAAEPELILLDEPLAALDAQTAPEIRQLLRRHLRDSDATAILVTHDALDAAMLADRVVVLDHGRVVEAGATAAVLAAPSTTFVASLAGLNVLVGTASDAAASGAILTAHGTDGSPSLMSGLAGEPVERGDTVAAVFPPSAVAVYDEIHPGSPRNSWPATVVALEPGPSTILLRATLNLAAGGAPPALTAEVTPAAVAELDLHPGSQVALTVKATEVRMHRYGGVRLS